jgi:two-component system NtrC family sensor kinase
MKRKLFFSFLFLSLLSFCSAQDSTVVLSASMFDKYFQVIPLTAKDGWIFKEGNDTNWASKDISTIGWKKFNPTQLTIKNADKNGKAEGWFRIRFRLDSSFQGLPVGIQLGRWAATDVYIDGRHIVSSGKTGLNGKPYKENQISIESPTVVDLVPGVDHILALHIVDHRSPLKSSMLKTELHYKSFGNLLELTGPESQLKDIDHYKRFTFYWTLWVSVCSVLAIVFWLLYFQNRSAKNLLFVSIAITSFSIAMFMDAILNIKTEMSFISWAGMFYVKNLFYGLSQATGILFLVYAFSRKVSVPLKLLLIIVAVSGAISDFYFKGALQLPLGILFLLICFYFIISSWKNLRGAQWALVVGILSTCIWNVLLAYNSMIYRPAFPFPFVFLYMTGTFLSFPLSQMVYVVMRFKEILLEVQKNANQVIHLTEEKKDQALKQQKVLEEEVAKQTIELRTAFENLKSTQSQLIQSEKMASLGELTAGIAHEIQNPLNFVNNFSDVNTELIGELKSEKSKVKSERNEELENQLLNDIEQNLEKINHHGKRADAIVKGMLQHSRTSSGQKEPTDINALADEYLRLAYHGLRAKDKSFNADVETDFDNNIGKLNIIPQDIGRVILNLINNAFYTVNEKAKLNIPGYKPTIVISTKKSHGKVEISVQDNGNGIPESIREKIFQPFFTTKPTGQGTGLGLSLSYEIVTKGHGGKLFCSSKDGTGSIFIIELPT